MASNNEKVARYWELENTPAEKLSREEQRERTHLYYDTNEGAQRFVEELERLPGPSLYTDETRTTLAWSC